jgi:hypothetical protein
LKMCTHYLRPTSSEDQPLQTPASQRSFRHTYSFSYSLIFIHSLTHSGISQLESNPSLATHLLYKFEQVT